MKLSSTVKRFSTVEFHDAYSVTNTFMGRLDPYNESKGTGISAHRRILETTSDTTIPMTKTIEDENSQIYITGSRTLDYWKAEVIRHKYALIPVEVSGDFGDIGQILNGHPAESGVYAFPYATRRESIPEDQSDALNGYDIYFPPVYDLTAGTIFVVSDTYYRLITDGALDGVGFLYAAAVKLDSPGQTMDIEVSGTTYDPVTDSYSSSSYPAIDCFVEPLSKDYEFVTPAFEKIEAGDKAISMLKSLRRFSIHPWRCRRSCTSVFN